MKKIGIKEEERCGRICSDLNVVEEEIGDPKEYVERSGKGSKESMDLKIC